MAFRHDIGSFGETLALAFLIDRGCSLVDRNVFVDRDELDLIIRDAGHIVAVEVKTSANGDDPLHAVDGSKAVRIRRAVGGYRLVVHRIDVIAVTLDRSGASIRWLPGVL